MITFHPLANIFPLIEGVEFENLAKDVKDNGVLEKIVLLDGQILDGRNRFRAGIKAGLFQDGVHPNTGMWFVDFTEANFGADAIAAGPLAFVLSKNLHRRHLDVHQRAMVAARLANMPQGARTDLEPSANLPKVDQAGAAGALHVSVRSVGAAKAVLEKGTPQLIAAAERGMLSISLAEKAARLSPETQNEVAKEAEAGHANPVRTVIKKAARDARETALGAKILALPEKKFGVILADPEWEFVVWSNITGLDRSAVNHYDVSPWEKISARDIQKIAAKDCICFLWVTDLARGIDVLRAWGFEYKSYIVWAKDIVEVRPDLSDEERADLYRLLGLSPQGDKQPRILVETGPAGTGYWNRDRDEILLIGTRGKVVAPAMGTQGESVWFSPRPKIEGTLRGRHSAKPDDAYEWLEKHYPNTPKIELNARKARDGWDNWGYEAPSQDPPEGGEGSGGASATKSENPPDPSTETPAAPAPSATVTTEDIKAVALDKTPRWRSSLGDDDAVARNRVVMAEAKALVISEQNGSATFLQRGLAHHDLTYDDAYAIMDMLEQQGVVSKPDAQNKRTVLVSPPEAVTANPEPPPPLPARASEEVPFEIPEFLRRPQPSTDGGADGHQQQASIAKGRRARSRCSSW